ncbi:hypothetical protein V500_00606 [Pseudogymnoascus sp. VKM F-4518 (FW-2643)]|nr:hypothetical protein V500_00606 [Pseudogymnoascus sp. VKM F-4518 (FW-2643)]
MSGVGEAGLVLGIISAIISIIDATKQVYEAVDDEAGLPTNFKKSATKLPLISKLLEDAERYVNNAADDSIKAAFTPTLKVCKVQATQLQELFKKVMPEEGDSRWDRYGKAARTIGKGGRVESLVGGILDNLQLLATRFPEVTTPRGKDQLAKAIEEVIEMDPSLPDGFEQMPAYAHYGSGAQNINTGAGPQYNNNSTGNQLNGPGNQYIVAVKNEAKLSYHNSASHQQSIVAVASLETGTRGNKHWIVPRSVNNLFTGRIELLRRMKKALSNIDASSIDKRKIFVITGLGGQGKSEICLKVASLMREEFWGVFWVDVNTPSTAENGFIAVAKELEYSVKNVPDALRALANTKQSWLLILDNADDMDFNYQVYLPSGTYGTIIITSRVYECRNYHTIGAEAIEGLEDQDSQELLFKAAELPQESWSSHTSEAGKVLRMLGSHTLALIQAGAYIARGHCKLDEYPKVYQKHRIRLLKSRPKQAQSRYGDVYATFEASADVLKQSKSEAANDALQLLEILSMLNSSVLPLQIFQNTWQGCREVLRTNSTEKSDIDTVTVRHVLQLPAFITAGSDEWDSYRLTEASYLLASLSLATQHDLDSSPGLSMHPLTHAWAKDRQNSEQQNMAWIATGCVLALSRFNTHIWRTQERRLLLHIQSFLDIKIHRAFSLGSKAIVIPILLKCGFTLLDMRQDSTLGCLLEGTFVELRQKPEQPLAEFLPLYDLQARSLVNLGKNQKAVELLEEVVKIREAILAEDHPDRLASQHALAGAYQANGQVKDAVELLKQVVKIKEAILAKDHPNRLASQHALAGAYQANGQVKDAVELLEQVVKIKEAILAKDHPSRLASQHALAGAYLANGQVKDAVKLLKQMVKIEEAILAEDHLSQLALQHALAGAY